MITYLEGVLRESLPTQAVIEVHGVGYEVFIPLSSYDRLPPPGQTVRLLTHLVVREDAHILFGFASAEERDLFRLLVNRVSGVGPKLALAVLSGMDVRRFKAAVVDSDIAAIAKISGLGKKTAERIVLELKDKLGVAAAWEAADASREPAAGTRATNDAILALIALGYKQAAAAKAVREVAKGDAAAGTELIVREALKLLL